ncbi:MULTISPECIES: lysozyme [Arsenophonus]|jgi:lysozyme|uniref:lysozyme n=1 Tax=Arsenophonus TaxID=637 RepID=UPI0015D7FDB0|nr:MULTISPECIES: lysozyme [Arsenophonus]UBX30293.1 lysozyme [Arsenophonus apicola]
MKIPKKIVVAAGGGVMLLASTMIMHFEGLELAPYFDGGGVLSVCYGHTGKDIERKQTYTKAECEQWLNNDLQTVKKQVDPLIQIKINTLTQAAIYSFVYNVGIGNFQRSTLLKKLNAGDQNGACEAMKQWVYVGKEKWQGLMTRREIESAICAGNI